MIGLRNFLFILALLAASPVSAFASSLLQDRAYWIDESNTASFHQAVHANYQPYTNTLTKGYLNHPVWLRLQISAVDEHHQPLVLRIRPPFLKNVTLYDPAAYDHEHVIPQQSGRSTPLDSTGFEAIDLGFEIPAMDRVREVYLRIDTPTSLIADIQVLSLSQASQEARHLTLIMSLYIGALLSATMWGLVNFFISRRGLYSLFAFRQIASAAHIVVFTGLYRYLIETDPSNEFSNTIYNVIISLTILPVVLFDVRLLKEFHVRRFYRYLPLAIASLTLLALPLFAYGQTSRGLQLSSTVALFATLSLLIPAFIAKTLPHEPFSRLSIWLLRGGFALTALATLAPVLTLLNGIDLTKISLNLMTAHAGISTIQLMSLLYISSKQREFEFQQKLIEGQVAQSMLAHESKQRVEKENYLAMVTHELRNPLSVIRLLARSENGSDSVQRAVNDMAHIIERVVQSEKFESNQFAICTTDIDLALLLQELRAQHADNPRVFIHSPDPISICSDHNLLLSALNNLIDNALKYSPQGAPVQVSALLVKNGHQDGVQMSVSNEVGDAGVPDTTKLFSKFYRSPGAHRQIGSGLGLYLVKQWVAALGGTLDYRSFVDSSDMTFIEFSLWLPKQPAP